MQTEDILEKQLSFCNELIRMELRVLGTTFAADQDFKKLQTENSRLNHQSFKQTRNIHMRLKALILNKLNKLNIKTSDYVDEYEGLIACANKGEKYSESLEDFGEKLIAALSTKIKPEVKQNTNKPILKTQPLAQYKLRTSNFLNNSSTGKMLESLGNKTQPIKKTVPSSKTPVKPPTSSVTTNTTSKISLLRTLPSKISNNPTPPAQRITVKNTTTTINSGKEEKQKIIIQEIPKKNSRNDTIAQILQESLKEKNIYFNFPYLYLNQLTCWLWHYGNQNPLPVDVIYRMKECLGKIFDEIKDYEKYYDPVSFPTLQRFLSFKKDLEHLDSFSNEAIIGTVFKIVKEMHANKCLPRDFEYPLTPDNQSIIGYPGSKTFRLASKHSAHNCGKVIATAGARDYYELEDFLNIFFDLKKTPTQILSLGKDFIQYFTNQETMQVGKITIKRKKDTNELILIKDKKQITLRYYNIDVDDNCTINLNYAGLFTLLQIYNNASEEAPVVIHCTAGVGRTGQVRFIFALLDKIKNDAQFSLAIDKLVRNEPLTNDEITYVGKNLRETLFSIRKIRYGLQTSEQYIYAFRQFLLLRALQLDHTKEDIEIMQQDIMKQPKDLKEISTFLIGAEETVKPTPFTAGLCKAPSAKFLEVEAIQSTKLMV